MPGYGYAAVAKSNNRGANSRATICAAALRSCACSCSSRQAWPERERSRDDARARRRRRLLAVVLTKGDEVKAVDQAGGSRRRSRDCANMSRLIRSAPDVRADRRRRRGIARRIAQLLAERSGGAASSPERAIKGAHVLCEGVRLLHGGEMPALRHDRPAANVREHRLRQRSRGTQDLAWEFGVTGRRRDGAALRESSRVDGCGSSRERTTSRSRR